MAIVANKAMYGPLDKKLSIPNRTNAGTPIGSITPLYASEIVLDTNNSIAYRAYGTTNINWLPMRAYK